MSSPSTLTAPVRVITTTHSGDGTSVFQPDRAVQPSSPFGPNGSSFAVIDERASVPVSNHRHQETEDTETGSAAERLPRCPPPRGVSFGVTNFAPRHSTPMHRTPTRDYVVVVSGEMAIELDGGTGEERTVRAGDFVVQGGANHMWHNRTDEVCRVAYVMVAAEEPAKLGNGQESS